MIQSARNILADVLKSRAFSILVSVSALVLVGALAFLVGDFSLRGTLVIVGLYSILRLWHKRSLRAIRAVYNLRSRPYVVHIQPNYERILHDLGLVSAEWHGPTIEGRFSYYPWTPQRTYRYGIDAVVLASESYPELVHWTGPNHYTRNLEYQEDLDFLQIPQPARKNKFEDNSDWSPWFYLKVRDKGYEIGISVTNRWWIENKVLLEKAGIIKRLWNENTKFENAGIECGDLTTSTKRARTEITVAILPFCAFYPIDFKDVSKGKMRKLYDRIMKELPLAGWTVEGGLRNLPILEWEIPWSSWRKLATYTCDYAEIDLKLVD